MTETLTGGCLCGSVRFACTQAPQIVAHCGCADCRKSSGTTHCTHLVITESAFELTGEVKFYDHPADSGNMVSRGFCPNCGSPVFSRNSGMQGMVFPRASVLDDPGAVSPQMLVYASRLPAWDKMDPGLPSFPEMPPQMPVGSQ